MSNWIHTINPFEVATDKSRKKMLILINDHSSRLQQNIAEALINTLYNRTAPLREVFSLKYSTWLVASGQWKAETTRVNNALKSLSSEKIEDWDIRIQVVFKQNTEEYISLLPQRRIPFQQGTMDERIEHVRALAQALINYNGHPSLVTLQGETQAFYEELRDKRNVQQNKEEGVKQASAELELARMDCAVMMFRNLGMLLDANPTRPEDVVKYYQMDLIQDNTDTSEEFEGPLAPGEFKNAVPSGKVTQQSKLFIKNTGASAITIGLSDNPHGFSQPTGTLQPGEELEYNDTLPELTAYYINVQNQSGSTEGSYLIIVS